jgi:hypothetical protein
VVSGSAAIIDARYVPGNLPGHSTPEGLGEGVSATLGVTVDGANLDVGYVTLELVTGEMRYLAGTCGQARLPHREAAVRQGEAAARRGKHPFAHDGHAHFGRRLEREVFCTVYDQPKLSRMITAGAPQVAQFS